jgi:hypothetical protein
MGSYGTLAAELTRSMLVEPANIQNSAGSATLEGLSNALEPPSIDRMRAITRAGQIHLRGSRRLRCCTENADASTSFSQTQISQLPDPCND